jgi:hypothetical protein
LYFIVLAGTQTHLRWDQGRHSSVHSVRAVWSVTIDFEALQMCALLVQNFRLSKTKGPFWSGLNKTRWVACLWIKPTWRTIFLSMFISFLYMFPATVPIIRRNNCICVTLGIRHSVWMTVWYPPCIPDSHPHRVTNTKCRIDSYFYWWWAHSCPKHVEKRNKHTKKNCAPSWPYLQDYTRMHGQQNKIDGWHSTTFQPALKRDNIFFDASLVQLRWIVVNIYGANSDPGYWEIRGQVEIFFL